MYVMSIQKRGATTGTYEDPKHFLPQYVILREIKSNGVMLNNFSDQMPSDCCCTRVAFEVTYEKERPL